MATIYPAVGEEKAVAQQLLAMAGSVRDVQVSTDTAPGTGNVAFVVPDELCDRYVTARASVEASAAWPYTEVEAVEAPVETPVKKRRGRPRKQPVEAPVEESTLERSEDSTGDETDEVEDPEE